ncbi:hypothetical protein ACL07V_07505 [Streptomyces sp. MB22_4]|uniref:hypothetical protein n=1 Tax=Streptomyces sp. MB22_4 TaxID=3383120 RepID=UPI0039A3A5B7
MDDVEPADVLGRPRMRTWTFPGRPAKARPRPGRRKGWCAGPMEPGNVIVMFFQAPMYE